MQSTIRNLAAINPIANLLGSKNQVIQMLSAWALSNLALEGVSFILPATELILEQNRVSIFQADTMKKIIPLLQNSTNGDVLIKCMWLLTNLAHTGK